MAAVPGGAGANRGVRGQVRYDESGNLEYRRNEQSSWSKSPAEVWYLIMEKERG